MPAKVKIITCGEWGARPPKGRVETAGKPDKIIDHHTDGHAPGSSIDDAKAYARQIQHDHMAASPSDPSKPWKDSGHNFLICRNGVILEGRHGTVAAINRGLMVVSAHCPGQNGQPGIEHEHLPGEDLTKAQKQASIDLHVWICSKTGISPAAIHPHNEYVSTSCPDTLAAWLPALRRAVAAELGHSSGLGERDAYNLWKEWRFGEQRFKRYGPKNPKMRPRELDTPEWNPAPRAWLDDAIDFLLRDRHGQ